MSGLRDTILISGALAFILGVAVVVGWMCVTPRSKS